MASDIAVQQALNRPSKTHVASPSMARRPSPTHAALALALACQACGTTALPRPSAPVDTDVSRSVRAVPSERALVRVQQSGSTLTLSATRTCDLHAIRTVDRAALHRIVDDRSNNSAVWALGVGNVVGIAGAITIHASLATSQEHLARDLATGGVISAVGAVLIGVGVALYRSNTRVEVRRTRVDVDDGLVSKSVPCNEVNAAAHVPVTGKMLGPPHLEIPFGDTNAQGALVIELSDALPSTLLRDAPAGATLTLYLGVVEVGTARLDEVVRAMKEQNVSEEARRE
jgi:hypothetical protein